MAVIKYNKATIENARKTISAQDRTITNTLNQMQKKVNCIEELWQTDSGKDCAQNIRRNLNVLQSAQEKIRTGGLQRFLVVVEEAYETAEAKISRNAALFKQKGRSSGGGGSGSGGSGSGGGSRGGGSTGSRSRGDGGGGGSW